MAGERIDIQVIVKLLAEDAGLVGRQGSRRSRRGPEMCRKGESDA